MPVSYAVSPPRLSSYARTGLLGLRCGRPVQIPMAYCLMSYCPRRNKSPAVPSVVPSAELCPSAKTTPASSPSSRVKRRGNWSHRGVLLACWVLYFGLANRSARSSSKQMHRDMNLLDTTE